MTQEIIKSSIIAMNELVSDLEESLQSGMLDDSETVMVIQRLFACINSTKALRRMLWTECGERMPDPEKGELDQTNDVLAWDNKEKLTRRINFEDLAYHGHLMNLTHWISMPWPPEDIA